MYKIELQAGLRGKIFSVLMVPDQMDIQMQEQEPDSIYQGLR